MQNYSFFSVWQNICRFCKLKKTKRLLFVFVLFFSLPFCRLIVLISALLILLSVFLSSLCRRGRALRFSAVSSFVFAFAVPPVSSLVRVWGSDIRFLAASFRQFGLFNLPLYEFLYAAQVVVVFGSDESVGLSFSVSSRCSPYAVHVVLGVFRHVNFAHRIGVYPRIVHTGGFRRRRRIKILHLFGHIVYGLQVFGKFYRVFQRASGMT